jgi:hypothetical protein
MAHSNRPSKRGIPGVRPGYSPHLEERVEQLAYTDAILAKKAEKRAANQKRTREGIRNV